MSNTLFLMLLGPPAVSDSDIPKSLGSKKQDKKTPQLFEISKAQEYLSLF